MLLYETNKYVLDIQQIDISRIGSTLNIVESPSKLILS